MAVMRREIVVIGRFFQFVDTGLAYALAVTAINYFLCIASVASLGWLCCFLVLAITIIIMRRYTKKIVLSSNLSNVHLLR